MPAKPRQPGDDVGSKLQYGDEHELPHKAVGREGNFNQPHDNCRRVLDQPLKHVDDAVFQSISQPSWLPQRTARHALMAVGQRRQRWRARTPVHHPAGTCGDDYYAARKVSSRTSQSKGANSGVALSAPCSKLTNFLTNRPRSKPPRNNKQALCTPSHGPQASTPSPAPALPLAARAR